MLDVHPPHEPAHSWTDFFIHIATIVVGLIIAVGLEQTVEMLHNRHLRIELQEQLHEQSDGNKAYIREDVRIAEAYFDWAQQSGQAIASAAPNQPVPLGRMPAGIILFPDTGVWLSAKDNGRTALLSAEEQVWYSDLYRMEQRAFGAGIGAQDQLQAKLSALDQALMPLQPSTAGAGLQLKPPTPEQRALCVSAFAAVQEASRDLERELLMFDAANNFVHDTAHGHWFDEGPARDYLNARLKAYAEHPRSQYVFAAK